MAPSASDPAPIIDSHIHLFPGNHLSTLAWMTPENPLNSQHSVSEYLSAVSRSPPEISQSLRGFVFLETDRISSLSPENDGWTHVADEVTFLSRIALGTPLSGEGHEAEHQKICLGIVPWAPVAAGKDRMTDYLARVRDVAGDAWNKVKGFRYLVQDKPEGTMTTAQFGEGLDVLAEAGMSFDLGIDVKGVGLWQLVETLEMVSGILNRSEGHEEKMITLVINHMCKPNMELNVEELSKPGMPDFEEWQRGIRTLAKYPKSYMKLSGGFAQLPPQTTEKPWSSRQIVDRMKPWTDVIFDAFGPQRILFGSDWPVCNVGGAGNAQAWKNWQAAIGLLLQERGLSEEEQAAVWSGTAAQVYNIKE